MKTIATTMLLAMMLCGCSGRPLIEAPSSAPTLKADAIIDRATAAELEISKSLIMDINDAMHALIRAVRVGSWEKCRKASQQLATIFGSILRSDDEPKRTSRREPDDDELKRNSRDS